MAITKTDKTTAITILQQLGGNKFLAMTGAHKLVALSNGMTMKLRRNQSQANYLKITLNGMDLYDLKFISIRGESFIIKNQLTNIYADQLQEIFTEITGMYTSL